MKIHATKPLFAWEELDDSPSIATLRNFLETIPDSRLLHGLTQARGRGRNDYPVRVLWGVILLTIALRHRTIEGCLAELNRNGELRRLIDIEFESGVPKKWNVSRFLQTLGQEPHLSELRHVFDEMTSRLGSTIPDLGVHLAGDSTTLNARRSKSASKGEPAANDLPQPTGGRKEYTDDEGRVTKVHEWFGYKLHLLVDVRHEVALAYSITSATSPDNEQIGGLLEQAENNLPADRIDSLAYDKAGDDEKVHRWCDERGIKPVIQNRQMWKDEAERTVPGIDASLPIVHDEAGTIYCYDKVSEPPVRHQMAYTGHEPSRRALKYRCPAKHEGWSCPSEETCNKNRSYGLTVRVDRDLDLRRFPPVPRATKKFERLYKGRTAVERVNGRLKLFWGADDGNIAGAERFFGFMGALMIVHAAMATLLASAPRWEGTLSTTRLGPIGKALRQKISPKRDMAMT